MKPGFGGKKNKKKKQKKAKSKNNADASMEDAANMSSDDGIDYTIPKDTSVAGELSAKERQKSKIALKAALKVKVAKLKQARNKLTKVPGNKIQRKEVSEAKQAALTELRELQKDKTQKKAAKKKNKKGKAGGGGGGADGAGGQQQAPAAGAEAMDAD
ncbi:hypothetical protein PLESTB_000922300 [Pleodorina starrii]|uniref:Uncharacterized protein n=1 Tax=Pleodorina starrii TaxID=330485 RepID=A0A9W6BP59_9CHLO|nr:hypothetical protein PLESTM_001533200 [Pleodorina starrii]GLC54936.1 hypothetical protein PLESTB_000922300 [Pleodorina starrii]GLC73617.1 hypothetical protein PLESTF_001400500 [Pleodorina starrii]